MSVGMASSVSEMGLESRPERQATGNLVRRKLTQRVAFGLAWLSAFVAVAALVWIVEDDDITRQEGVKGQQR